MGKSLEKERLQQRAAPGKGFMALLKKRPLRENADTTKKCVAHFRFPFLVSGKGIFIFHKFSHLTIKYLIRKNTYFS